MAVNPLVGRTTIEEFLAVESSSEQKHELYDGRVWAMSGAGEPHRSITPVLHRICGNALRGSHCRYFDQDTKVVIEEKNCSFYPDGGIACPPNLVDRTAGGIDNPRVLFEVLSPSTEAKDRGQKFEFYTSLPSLQDYVLINTRHPRVEVFSRQADETWVLAIYLKGSVASIPSVGLDIPLDELYEDAVFDEEPTD